MKFAWIDLRSVSSEQREAVVDAAVHARLEGVLDDKLDVLATLPPTVLKVLLPAAGAPVPPEAADVADLVLTPIRTTEELDKLKLEADGSSAVGAFVDVVDDPTLRLACAAAIALPNTLVKFRWRSSSPRPTRRRATSSARPVTWRRPASSSTYWRRVPTACCTAPRTRTASSAWSSCSAARPPTWT